MSISRTVIALAMAICFMMLLHFAVAHAEDPANSDGDEDALLMQHISDQLRHEIVMAAQTDIEEKTDKVKLRDRVVSALESLVRYFAKHTDTMPVDALYGIRGMEGMLMEIVQSEDANYLARVRKLLRAVQRLAGNTQRAMDLGSQRKYFLQFKPLVDKAVKPLSPFQLGKSLRKPFYNPSDISSERRAVRTRRHDPRYRRIVSEGKSDVCIEQAIHCRITNHCMNLKQLRFTKGYRLTHQVLYYLYLWQRCQTTLTPHMHRKVLHNLKSLTANMHAQYKLDREYSDLWVERVLFGILAGYHEYFLTEGLAQYLISNHYNKVLGCWEEEGEEDDDDDIPRSVYTSMRDIDIGDGCSFHTSGIVGWILAAHLRYHA